MSLHDLYTSGMSLHDLYISIKTGSPPFLAELHFSIRTLETLRATLDE
jgi:hypothetical protein